MMMMTMMMMMMMMNYVQYNNKNMFVAKITMLDAIIRKIIYVITDLF